MFPLSMIKERMSKLKNWALEGSSIVKDFSFGDFKQAMIFVNRVAEIAEKRDHHPSIVVSYNKVRLSLTTHSEKGLTSKDFEVAEDIDKL